MTNLIRYYNTLPPKEQRKLCNKYFKWLSTHDSAIGDVSFQYCIRHHLQFEGNHGTSCRPIHLYAIPIPQAIHDNFHLPPMTWKDTKNAYVEKLYGIDVVEVLKEIHSEYEKVLDIKIPVAIVGK